MAKETINPEVLNSIADMDDNRIQERSTLDYPRHFWSSLKNGHYRFALTGVAIAVPLSAAIGAVVCGVIAATVATTTAIGLAPLIIPAFVATGALMAVEGFGSVGASAASRASGLAEKHARLLDADMKGKIQGKASAANALDATDDQLMYNGHGQHFEYPHDRDNGKYFALRSGLTGMAMGAASGAVMGMGLGSVAAESTVVTTLAHAIGSMALVAGIGSTALAAVPALAIAGALTFGALGLYFGVERKMIKSVFNETDTMINGKVGYTNGPDLGRAQSKESDYDLAQHRLRRQEEIDRLEKSYNERISWGALTGRFKGFAGAIPGILAGAAAGLAVLGALAVVPGGLAVVAAAHGLILPLFASAGGVLGMTVFAESGTQAGAEATARAIDTEFEHNRALRAQGITPPTPKNTDKGPWLSPKAGLICGVVGAAAGIALAPWIGPPALAFAHITGAAALSLPSIATSATISGLVGASYGLTGRSLKAMSAPATWIYDKANKNYHHNYFTEQQEQAQAQSQLLHLPPPAPALNAVTPEEAALLDERLKAGNGKNFSQMTQQQAPVPQTVGV